MKVEEGLNEELETFLRVALSDMELEPSYKRGKPRILPALVLSSQAG